MSEGFWADLAARVRPTEMLRTVEDPRVIVGGVTGGFLGGALQLLIFSGLFVLFDEISTAIVASMLSVVFVVAWIWFASSGSVFVSGLIVLVGSTVANVYVHVGLGGYAYSGAIFLFSVALVTSVAVFLGRTAALTTAATYVAIGIVLGFLEESLRVSREPPDPNLTTVLFVALLVGSINVVVPLLIYFMGRLRQERERAENLLLNVLPSEIAAELKVTGETVPRRYDSISVLFADTVGFTPLSASLEPEEVVAQLNEVFTHFDSLADEHGVEKIRTIGDSYMAAAGVPAPRSDHAQALAAMSLDMLAYAESSPLAFRIGIHSGPVSLVSSAVASSSTTSGGTRSTRPRGWSHTVRRVGFR